MTLQNARKQKRKQDRVLMKQGKHKHWVEHQQSRKLRKNMLGADAKDVGDNGAQPMEILDNNHISKTSHRVRDDIVKKMSEDELKHVIRSQSVKKNLKDLKTKKTKFAEYLVLENKVPTADKDLEMERRLAKKLRVKNGKLGGDVDDINILLGGSDQEYAPHGDDTEIIRNIETKKKKKRKKKTENLEQDIEVLGDDNLREDRGIEVSEASQETRIEIEDVKKIEKKKKGKEKRKKTKFEEYLVIENTGASTAEEDLELERRLAKKLKVKDGKLPGDDDGLGFLFEDSDQEYAPHNDDTKTKEKKIKKKKRKTLEQDVEVSGSDPSARILHENEILACSEEECVANAKLDNGKVEAPTIRNYVAPHLRARSSDSNDNLLIRRRIRGLLNRLSESNMESITGEVSAIFQSIGRSVASQIVAEEVLASCAGGPRGNEQYAAAFAAFVSGLTCMIGIEFGAKLLVLLAKSFEKEYLKEDNLSLRNMTLLLSYLYIFGVCSSDLIYDFLLMLTKRMTEIDVSTILTVLQCCGMKLRSDDPAAMKEFIFGVQNRVTEMKASLGDDQVKTVSRRMDFMLETICDIKNNKKRKEEHPQHTRVKKWLQKLRMDDFAICGIKWSKLLDPEKKGQWWLTGDLALTDNVEEVAGAIDKEVHEAQKMLDRAALLRMNTDIRKAIFCVIMSGEDYLDAYEKLMRLGLKGKQDREIMRVLVECCSQEKIFNKYYTALAIKLCEDRNQKSSLQFCLWDQFKELDSMTLVRLMHLAKFLAEMLVSFKLSMAVLKVVDFSDVVELTPKRIMHFRILFDTLFAHPDSVVWSVFAHVAGRPELEAFRTGMEFFIMEHVLPSNHNAKQKFKLVKKALNNIKVDMM
ncbi:hypothetical protein V2J09_018627 [Rumex salicifolius]